MLVANAAATADRAPTPAQEALGTPARPLRVLVLSSLYPSAVHPRHGIFVETRLRQLLALGGIEARVISPVPWFFSRSPVFGRYAQHAAMPQRETRHGIAIDRPRYLMIPKVGMRAQAAALARAALPALQAVQRGGFDFDVIEAEYFYPDGVAAASVAGALGKPFVVTALGSDLNQIGEDAHCAAAMLDASLQAGRVLCVSSALRDTALDMGMAGTKVEVLRNGVDTDLFAPGDRAACRAALRIPASASPVLLAVGNLVPLKDFALAIEMLPYMRGAHLVIVGDGPEHAALVRHAQALGVDSRVTFRPAVPQPELPAIYNAGDVLLLTSQSEGWPNVVLEAMACGVPVVAFGVGGVPEIIGDSNAGRVVRERTAEALLRAVDDMLRSAPGVDRVREHALAFGWKPVVQRLRDVLLDAVGSHAHAQRERAGTGAA